MAKEIAPSGKMYGLTADQAMIAMLTGYELGLPLVGSLNLIYVVQTKNGLRPALSTQAMNALIRSSGVLREFNIVDKADGNGYPYSCTVRMVRGNGSGYEYTFTIKDAERAELLNKTNWQHHPDAMLRARAISACARVVCPDVLAGLYLADELGAVTNADGEPIEGEFVVEPKSAPVQAQPLPSAPQVQAAETPTPPAVKVPTFDELLKTYSPADIMAANGGKIPQTDEEMLAVAHNLEAGI